MAIVQISRITNRKGLQEDLPQLAGAELGWSVDERRLFIGNGTLEEGAPAVGNTEILTEFSDILAFKTSYIYSGLAATGYSVQTGPNANSPVSQSLQNWMDQWASVKDFGAVGDGVTDDTDAINRALYQLYCRETNPQIRRSLFFPAGVYLVNQTINIPTYATLYGEGKDNSVITLAAGDDSSIKPYVARTADSLQQVGDNIGANGATPPAYITISNLGFETQEQNFGDVFLVEQAVNCSFTNVNFTGSLTTAELTTSTVDISGIRFASTPALVCSNITFDRCVFSGTVFAVNTDQQVQGITIANSNFNVLYQGVILGTGTVVDGGPTGVRIVNNFFNNIYAEGIILGDVQLNVSGYNIFYDVGNHFAGTLSPATPVITIESSNNVSIGDMFERTNQYSLIHPRINTINNNSISITNGSFLELGQNVIQSQSPLELINNESVGITLYNFDVTMFRSLSFNYSITRGNATRTGTFRVVPTGSGTLTYDDDYVENASVGITLFAIQVSDTVSIQYTSTNTGIAGSLNYTISKYRI